MGGIWTWRVDYHDTIGAFLFLSSLGACFNDDVQADALLIVEQIRDYKDARYALAVPLAEISRFKYTLTAERGSAPFWTRSRIWIRNSTSHKS